MARDTPTRLRQEAKESPAPASLLMKHAANEIDRLTAELEEAKSERDQILKLRWNEIDDPGSLVRKIVELEEIVADSTRDILLEPVLRKRTEMLEDELFRRGAMEDSPCFCCGYNGPGYYQPASHSCAERHHRLVGGPVEAEEITRLTAELEEREADMHIRIRKEYDSTVANCWRAKVEELEAKLAAAQKDTARVVDSVREAISLTSELYEGPNTYKGAQTLWNCQKANDLLRAAIDDAKGE